MQSFLDKFLPWFCWRRLVWVSKGSPRPDGSRLQSRVTQYVPFWRVRAQRRRIESLDQFSHWYTTYPDGSKVRNRPRRPNKNLIDWSPPTADDLRWLKKVARDRGWMND